MKKILTLLLLSMTFGFSGLATTQNWNFSNWTAETITENKTEDGLTVYVSGSNTITIDGNNKTIDGTKYTQRLKFGGSSNWSTPYRVLSFEVDGPSEIKIALTSSSSSDANRTLSVYEGELASKTQIGESVTAPTSSVDVKTFSYTGTEATTIWIGVSNGINIYFIDVTPGTAGEDPVDPNDPNDPNDPVEDPSPAEICGPIIDGADLTLDGVVATSINGVVLTAPTGKNWSKSDPFKFNGITYTALKLSRNNVVEVSVPKGCIAKKVTILSAQNETSPKADCYWTVNGINHISDLVTKPKVTKNAESELDVYTYELDGTQTFTIKANGTQLLFMLAIEVEQQATISVGGYTTFCPIYSDLTIPEGVTAYTAVLNQDGTGVVITKVNGEAIPQGCGVVLEGTAGETYTFEMAESAAAIGDNEMVGATEDIDGLANVYVLGVKNGSCVFGNWTGDTFPAGKAYLNVSPKSNQPLRLIKAEESGIEGVSVDATDNGSIYNTLGQKVDGTYKGIVIKNGGKHINR